MNGSHAMDATAKSATTGRSSCRWPALAGRDCDLFQGFLFSRPLPADQISAYLRGMGRN